MLPRHPRRLTAGWTYLRFHGDRYHGGYSHQHLTARARWNAARLAEGIEVYAWFNNDEAAHAVHDALALGRYLAAALRVYA